MVAEELTSDGVPLWGHPEWPERFPWLVQGTTGVGEESEPFDLGVYGSVPSGVLMSRWRRLLASTGMETGIHSRQVHGAELAVWTQPLPAGLLHVHGYDGHLTNLRGVLLSVSVADCVPISLVCEEPRTVGLVHAGWRGVAASIVERAIEALAELTGAAPSSFWLHCGPSICGVCYEVGPEVHAGVRPWEAPPPAPTPIDLRAAVSERAVGAGVAAERMTLSGHCTRCGPGGFFSHRGGSPARQMGVMAIRD